MAKRGGFELPSPFRLLCAEFVLSSGSIQPEKSICVEEIRVRENLFAWDSALLRVPFAIRP
jgi:hypothetical protein